MIKRNWWEEYITTFYILKIHVHENKENPKHISDFHHAKQLSFY